MGTKEETALLSTEMRPQELVEFLEQHEITRFYLVRDPGSGRVVASHEALRPLADFVESDDRIR